MWSSPTGISLRQREKDDDFISLQSRFVLRVDDIIEDVDWLRFERQMTENVQKKAIWSRTKGTGNDVVHVCVWKQANEAKTLTWLLAFT